VKVVFRADASAQMGVGHLMRCLTLAETLRGRGVQTRFVCREHPGNLIPLLRQLTIPVTCLPAAAGDNRPLGEDYAAWLGVTQSEDAAQTVEALDGETPDWLVVDHYGLDAEWERRLRPHAGKLMVIDDLANRRHDCDVLLDQNYSAEGERRYASLLPDGCKLLVGPHYALLRPEYAAYRKTLRARDGQVRRVMVFFGGSDPQNVTGLALEALSGAALRHLEVDVVVGANNPHREALEKQAAERPQTTIYGPRHHLADLMMRADLAIGAGGTTTSERMCLGLPTVVVSIAKNQEPGCEALSHAGLIRYLGDLRLLRPSDLSDALKEWVGCRERMVELSTRSQLTVDGLGTLRLAECLGPTPAERLRLRPAREDDIYLYFSWANDPEVRRQAVRSESIPWAQHREWFAAKLANTRSHLFVMQAGELPVGQIRFDRENGVLQIDYSIEPTFRGRGWAKRLVAMGMNRLLECGPISFRAEVKKLNLPSSAVFLHLGFIESPSPIDSSLKVFLFDPRIHQLQEMC